MNNDVVSRTFGMTLMAVLALVHSVAGVLRALHWFDVGSDLMGPGLLLLAIIGVVAIFRRVFVAAIALLYAVFTCGVFLRQAWAWWLGLALAGASLLLVLSVVLQGESLGRAPFSAIVPVIMIFYLMAPEGRRAKSEG